MISKYEKRYMQMRRDTYVNGGMVIIANSSSHLLNDTKRLLFGNCGGPDTKYSSVQECVSYVYM